MAEFWDIVLSLIGAGCVTLGYVIHWIEEKRRRTHEQEAEYRRELKKYLPDLIEPLFKLIGNLWLNLNVLVDWESDPIGLVSGQKLTKSLGEIRQSMQSLRKFVNEKATKLDILLPHPLQSWQYTHVEMHIAGIFHDIKRGKVNIDDITDAVVALIDIQSDLQRLLGFETKMRLESEYTLTEPLSRFEKLKQKIGLSSDRT